MAAEWKQETLWVTRDEHGAIIRVSETHPSEWGKKKAIDHYPQTAPVATQPCL